MGPANQVAQAVRMGQLEARGQFPGRFGCLTSALPGRDQIPLKNGLHPIQNTPAMTPPLGLVVSILAIHATVFLLAINLDHEGLGSHLEYIPNLARKAKLDYMMSNRFGFGGHNASSPIGRCFLNSRT